ncbi:DNA polymerase IV [uncultured Rhodoblastus sp.]|uniref:DNA polymerase IV n=1 Tax=uncultured Rhodoblastus sp. TaxID=543037 RepID=UPI0025ECA04F|nr:DNA polymerase IV [uncultured Rhodoblastus sp.]
MEPTDPAGGRIRKIIHLDMDAFFASVEQRDHPELRDKPVAVGYGRERGVVAAASYEARKFGVRSAMPSVTALRKCPELIFTPPRFEVYKMVSRQIRAIFAQFTPLIEPLSLDEAYLDVTDFLQGETTATETAQSIRTLIRRETGLTASAGVSYNKFLAKLASDRNKPDGLCVITPKQGPAFVENLPVAKFHGVGPATAEKMRRLGIETGRDLKTCPLEFLQENFGKAGPYYYAVARGVDERPVRPDRERKSLGAERTYLEDLVTFEQAAAALPAIIDKVWRAGEIARIYGRTLTLKVKYSDFRQVTRSRTDVAPIATVAEFERRALALLAPLFPTERGVRLLGLTLSGFGPTARQGEAQLSFELLGQGSNVSDGPRR